jgi:hypothetical protein
METVQSYEIISYKFNIDSVRPSNKFLKRKTIKYFRVIVTTRWILCLISSSRSVGPRECNIIYALSSFFLLLLNACWCIMYFFAST